MKLLTFLAVFVVSLPLFANSNYTNQDIDRILEYSNQEEFGVIYQATVKKLIEDEEKEVFYNSSTFFNLLTAPKLYSIHYILFGEYVNSGSEKMCFFGGWMVYKQGRKCPRPWKMRNHSKFKRDLSAHVYSKEYNCGGSSFRCNPLIFGSTSSGNGKCINYSPVNNLSSRCASASADLVDAHVNKLKDDPILRGKFSAYLAELLKKCGKSRSGTCGILKSHLDKIVTKAKATNDVNLCRDIVEPVLNVDNVVTVATRINTPPVVTSDDDNEDIPTPVSLAEAEQKMFENYKKMGGDPKAFAHVMCFYKKHKESKFKGGHGRGLGIKDKCNIIINDYNKSSKYKRLFVMNRCTGKVQAMQSSHGVGGGAGAGKNSHSTARHISNKGNTNLSPSGFFIMGGWHRTSKPWAPGIKMHGLQKGINDNSYRRGVVFHRSKNKRGAYCGGGIASSDESSPRLSGSNCGRTHGCIGIPPSNWGVATDKIKGERSGGPLLYTYSHIEAAKPASYCGGSNLWQ
ncbi:MAG: murein L,D-transpeptidase catalytic domain family protein [Bacteriovoracaceae bacterium]|nr:murein L,D-transpeptidase catalytic domain family protein [Bacteriovoracaceae bacterium]